MANGPTEGIHTDFTKDMSYGDYLQLDTLLSAQQPLTQEHDELLFITIHQVMELWLKLLNRELDTALAHLRADELQPAFKCTARINRIQEQLIQAWTVLSTMTPSDYLSFRPALGQSSGFQSWQYRLVEFKLGAKDELKMAPHRHRGDIADQLEAAYRAPSLYDEALRLLARRGYAVPEEVLARDVTQPYTAHSGVEAVWEDIYRHSGEHFDLYELAEELVDLEDAFQQWRFRHMKTVERIIGMRRGTGGSTGVTYLRKALERYFFPELWSVRGNL
ncbi:tryptophan 2,3-dioxygenase [Microvirga guangxiensis]|uniref:Tryptophan 2,3-dioxygenase n=1 Tax=Microvirga guangxiensis TaxID=549386 RepID=A0A1G5JJ21_9HYPH|nr:tryptophan 2,3-dioxygenase [Microvirga guangxiensis]SCY88317.1 tryptophan 2,3-dioxygenase [Microvirga guangxiensis]